MSDLESKKMLEIIHQNHKKVNKKQPTNNIKEIIKSILLVGSIALFIFVCIMLTNQKNDAVNNCMKNHSRNYCERIAG